MFIFSPANKDILFQSFIPTYAYLQNEAIIVIHIRVQMQTSLHVSQCRFVILLP